MRRVKSSTSFLINAALLISGSLAGSSLAHAQIPRTDEGRPDFQGLWTNETETPVERPAQFSGRQTMTAEEAAAWRPGSAAGLTDLTVEERLDPDRGPPPKGAPIRLEADWFFSTGYVAHVDGEFRTSLVIDPPDGKIPYAENGRGRDWVSQQLARPHVEAYDGPELRPAGERCLLSVLSTAGPPMLPMSYNSNYRIVQTADYLMIMAEMVNDVRIVRIDDEHQPEAIHRWMGDSVGHWEGDTLVVSTRNIHPQQSFRGSTGALTTTEKFRFDADGQIIYQVIMSDDQVFGRPWTAEVPMRRLPPHSHIYEYACHEGNYSIVGALAGRRWQEHYEQQEAEN
ncbi:hypothetical protein [Pseudohongiella sp.]|uniref:Uncharacterized protein n=1 Tax=marine sediment metagenome TaxID=412755 RepID=A0A0F9Z6B8_9ZZZZ|nr:hypothetical protein [Pseudohongiella sp.]HDZ09478.1 hypothetical protein [Pseudohongiella sp.]HEA63950.1 hypothetical protein [Pseudohongiella sp.]